MIKKCCSENDLDILLEYIGKEYREAIYLYLDAIKYGISNPNVSSWIQTENEVITSIILMYHTGMHIYSKEKVFDASELVELILNQNPSIICAQEKIIEMISRNLKEYKLEIGNVAQCVYNEKYNSIYSIRLATPEDYTRMAKMLISDPDIGASYSLDEMIKQIEERIKDGYSRSYCMFDGEVLIAQASTGAEESGVATIAYVMTEPNYRGKGLGKTIVGHLVKELMNEGFDVFLIYYSDKAGRLYLNHGFKNVCRYGKLYKNV